ncbi:hypothetical protein H4219_004489 [Mycoemilia scoparia]|uniref:Protein kinase domain-containing protein n=1 Tax=Mycoemilia scoparia TaxID=417184 RepID=A0A9W8DMS9_9FUNG|nr:hypothetical protein H4219_004489 [Mycoemilia scoparia]
MAVLPKKKEIDKLSNFLDGHIYHANTQFVLSRCNLKERFCQLEGPLAIIANKALAKLFLIDCEFWKIHAETIKVCPEKRAEMLFKCIADVTKCIIEQTEHRDFKHTASWSTVSSYAFPPNTSDILPHGFLCNEANSNTKWENCHSCLLIRSEPTPPTKATWAIVGAYVQRMWSPQPRDFILNLVIVDNKLYIAYCDRGACVFHSLIGPAIPNDRSEMEQILDSLMMLAFTMILSSKDLGFILGDPLVPETKILINNSGGFRLSMRSHLVADVPAGLAIFTQPTLKQCPNCIQCKDSWVFALKTSSPIMIESFGSARDFILKVSSKPYMEGEYTEIDVLNRLAGLHVPSTPVMYYGKKIVEYGGHTHDVIMLPNYGVPIDDYFKHHMSGSIVRSVIQQTTSAILELSTHHILHRNIAPEHVLLRYDAANKLHVATIVSWSNAQI